MKKFSTVALILVCSYTLFAQTGPGGVGNATGASGQPRNILWLRAGSGVVVSGAVDSWADQSGNGLSAIGTGTTRPAFVASDANFNNQPSIDFRDTGPGNNHVKVTDNDILDNTTGLTLFTVFRSATVATDIALLSKRTSSGANQSYMLWINLNDLVSRINADQVTPALDNIAINTTYLGSLLYNGTITNPRIFNYLNGALALSGSGATSIPNNASDLFIGAFDISGGENRNLNGYMSEVVAFNSALNVAQRQIVENYLAAKYNLGITGDVYAGDATGFDFNVAGIGRASATSHTEASSAGFVLAIYNGSLDVDGEFLLAGSTDAANSVVNCACAGYPVSIQQRWARTWFVDKTTAGTLDASISFDFGDGIGGQFPQNKNDYELLYSSDGGTNFSIVAVVSGDKNITGDQISFRVANAALLDGIYTVGTTNSTASPVDGGVNRTWYSYQTGNANDPLVWTLDGGATPLYVNPTSAVPNGSDNVVITTGKTVTVTADNFAVNSLEVTGTLDYGQTSGHTTVAISGTGRIRFAGSASNLDNFPTGNTTAFANATTGGTVEIYGSANITLNQARVYNDLIINRTGGTISLTANHTLNGDFTVDAGTFQFGGTAANFTVYGNTIVNTGATISVVSASVRHQFNTYGNFTNNAGTVQFTNRGAANYTAEATDGIVDFNLLSGTQNQAVICNGSTKFYRIEIDKGTDDTYLATFTANAAGNFLLYGYSNVDHANTAQLTVNDNSFGLIRGTAEIGANISIPVLSNGGNFNVSAGATLWVNGGTVLKNAGNSLVPYGKIRISAGLLEAKVNAGITTRDNGTIIIEGGILNTNQIRTSVLGVANVGGYIQSGGTVTVDGGGPGGSGLDWYVFSLTYTGNVFNMSGGTLTVKGYRTGTAGTRGAIFINSDPANVSVTGGTVIAEISNATVTSTGAYPTFDNTSYKITSRAAFWNLILRNTNNAVLREVDLLGGASGPPGVDEVTLAAQNLVVKGSLTIESYAALDHNGKNINIAGHLNIQSNADLLFSNNVTRRNTTTLDGTDNATLSFLNRTVAAANDEQRFWNFVINKPSNKVVSMASGKADLTGSNNNLLRIDGSSFKLFSGILDQGFHSVRMYCDTVLNYQTVGIYSATSNDGTVANDRNDLIKLRDDNNPTKFLTVSTALFGPVRVNSGNDPIELVSDVRMQYVQYQYGKINLGSHRLTIDDLNATISDNADSLTGLAGVQKFSVEDMLVTNGNNSDGGLALLITADGVYDFPLGLGTTANDAANTPGTDKYTPAKVRVRNFMDDGYIIINPVEGILQTTDLAGGADILSYYWRVRFEGFTALPIVRYQFTYNDADVGGTEANYVPGKVLDVSPFTRSTDGGITRVNDAKNIIGFYGTASGFNGGGINGFTLEQANYTAGQTTRFSGSVEVFYTRILTDGYNTDWDNDQIWTKAPLNPAFGAHSSGQTATTDAPGPGDVAVIGWVPHDDAIIGNRGFPHGVAMNATTSVAEVRFTQMLDVGNNPTDRKYYQNFQFRPTLVLNNSGVQGQIGSGATVSGEGLFWIRSAGALSDPAFTGVDLGAFNAQDSSYFIYESTIDGAIYNNVPAEFPNLMMATDGWGNQNKSSTITKDITVKVNLELLGNINLVLNTGATGNITVNRHMKFFRSNANGNDSGGGGELRYGNTGTARSITVLGDLRLGNGFAADIRILSPGATPLTHSFNLHGNFTQNTTGGSGFKGGTVSTQDRIAFNLLGNTSMTLTTSGVGDAPQFYSLVLNKGTSTSTVANINANITINGPTNTATKPLTLTSGLLRLNHASIAVTLSSGGGDFSIPAAAGLEVAAGTVSLTGSDTGLLLDGLLRVSGGTVNIDDAVGNGNNFIEYSASGSAILEVTAGSLTVGSQVRRGLMSTAGILKYRQSGGAVVVGRRTAPTTSRGVFEVVNNGSEFTHSAGTLTLVRGINSATVPSLLIEPQTPALTIDPGSTIIIGSANTPAGVNGQNIGIKSNRQLGVLTINNSSGNSPRALIYSSPLSVNGTFTINTGTSFNAQGFDLTLRGNTVVNGTFVPSGNNTIFDIAAAQSLSGTGALNFYTFTKSGAGTLNVLNNITIANDLNVSAGTLADNGNTMTLSGNAYFGSAPSITGNHTSVAGGLGLVFSGSIQQQLAALRSDGTASLGTVTINNPNGVIVPDQTDQFTIETELRLQNGVLDIGGSLLTLAALADIEQVNLFSVTNMIQTNSSFTDNGVTKIFPIGTTTTFIFPVGQALYTPVIFDFANLGAGNGSGSTQASITVRPANERQPIIVEDVESGLCLSQIDDLNNVLQYHWIVTAANTNDFESNVVMYYDQSLVRLANGELESSYIGARIRTSDNTVFKSGLVDAGLNTITFQFNDVDENEISGEFLAGIDCAIPNAVLVYVTKGGGAGNGNVTDNTIYVGDPSPLSLSGSVIQVSPGDLVVFPSAQDNVTLYRTILNGTIKIESGSIGHRLGNVTGTGTLSFEVNAPDVGVVLPAGYYTNFISCAGGGFEFGGTANYEVMGGISSLRRLILSGSGNRTLGNNNVVICEDLTLNGPSFLNPNNRNIEVQRDLILSSGTFSSGIGTLEIDRDLLVSGGTFNGQTGGTKIVGDDLYITSGTFTSGSGGNLTLLGDLLFAGGSYSGGSGTHKTLFQGSSAQVTAGTLSLNRLEINNASGLTLGGTTTVSNELLLTNGNITPSGVFTMTLSAFATPAEGRSNSFVNGKLVKNLATGAGGTFVFPIGKGNRWRRGAVVNPTSAATWAFEHFPNSPLTNPLVNNLTPSSAAVKTVSKGEYWKVSSDIANTATVGLSWGIESDVSPNSGEREHLIVLLWNDGTSLWNPRGGTAFSGGHTQGEGSFNATSVISFSEQIVTLGSEDLANPLPVTFLEFKGKSADGLNVLSWSTASEKNNDYFELERSKDGEHFEVIGNLAGHGTINALSHYKLTDYEAPIGRSYYRLKQVDFDGKFSYHPDLVVLTLDETSSLLNFEAFPNPTVNRDINIRVFKGNNEPVQVRLIDTSGRVILSSEEKSRTVQWQAPNIPQGLYLIEVSQGQRRVTKRVIIEH